MSEYNILVIDYYRYQLSFDIIEDRTTDYFPDSIMTLRQANIITFLN